MNIVQLTFNKYFIQMAKSRNMTALQIIQYLICNLYFFRLYDEQVDNVDADVFATHIAIIEANLNEFKNDESVDLNKITLKYLTQLQQLRVQDEMSPDESKSLSEKAMADWEEELKPLVTLPSQITVQDYGTINLTIDFIMISMLTDFSFEQALQVYIDSYTVEIVT